MRITSQFTKNHEKPDIHAISTRIVQARKLAGLTQDKLATFIGVTNGAVAQYEIARHLPSYEKLERIATVTGVALSWLLTGDNAPTPRTAKDPQEGRALAIFRQIPKESQPLALTLLAAMAESARNTENAA